MSGMLSRWQGMHLLDHLRFVQYVKTRHLFSGWGTHSSLLRLFSPWNVCCFGLLYSWRIWWTIAFYNISGLGASRIWRGECQLYGPLAVDGGPWAVAAPRPGACLCGHTQYKRRQWTRKTGGNNYQKKPSPTYCSSSSLSLSSSVRGSLLPVLSRTF